MLRRLSICFFLVIILSTVGVTINGLLQANAADGAKTDPRADLLAITAELYSRSQKQGSRTPGQTSAAVSLVPTDPSLKSLSNTELVKMLRSKKRAIYGDEDNRQDIFKVADPAIRAVADSVVGIVDWSSLKLDNGSYTLPTDNYGERYGLCPDERFVSQPTGCDCTGFLIAPDLVATAGHCIEGKKRDQLGFVFGFDMENENISRKVFREEDVYRAKEFQGMKLTNGNSDWAVVKLEKPVQGHKPLRLSQNGDLAVGAELYVIGHPCGLPKKFTNRAKVLSNNSRAYFKADLDTYGGNSGSPVFDTLTNEVQGILVRGARDFVSTDSGCRVSYFVPPDNAYGESVTRISEIKWGLESQQVSQGQ